MEPINADEEFNLRIKHNFRLYVLLTSQSVHWSESRILECIWRLAGYKSHKTVKYGKNSSHIHVKFDDERSAKRAVKILNKMNFDLTAILVEDMLRGWFDYEIRAGGGPKWTLTIVDIVGNTPLSLNFLTSNIMNSIFADFGAPYLLPYTAALNEPHAQVLFGSMTEALAACMAFGEWYNTGSKMDSFCYRVRINPSDREAYLIKNSGGTPKEAFKLDYFVNLRDEIYQNSRNSGCDSKQSRILKNKMLGKGLQKVRKQKSSVSTDLPNVILNQLSNHTPILCVPIIAPLRNYAEAMAGNNSRLKSDFSAAVLNFQQTLSVSSEAKVTSRAEMESSYSAIVSKGSECRIVGNTEQSDQISEKVVLKDITPSGDDDIILNVPPVQQTRKSSVKTKSSNYRSTRVFERRP